MTKAFSSPNLSQMIDLNELNPQQRLAAKHLDGPLLILAGAGSGKTRTITYRMAYMISHLSIPPSSILAVSFTNKAAQEMEERVMRLLGKKQMKGLHLSTFHSLGTKILRKELHLLGYQPNFTIYDTSDQISLIREALKHYKSEKAFDRKRILAKIGLLKNKGISAEEFPASPFYSADEPYDEAAALVYQYYEEKLKFYNAIDFDDLLFLTVKIFKNFPEVAEQYSEKFRYIMIDEYQDTNPLQLQLVLSLTRSHNNLCVVGDDDQSIYSFRGADISNILEFEKRFPSTQVIKLEENYRSTAPILNLANAVIREIKGRKDKTMWTQENPMENPSPPMLWACGDSDHEANVVAGEISRLQQTGKKYSDIAVLYRSNTQVLPLEDALRMNNVPYAIIGGQKFYEKKEIKDLIAYLSAIHNPKDELSLRRILNIPHRGIGMATLNKFLNKSKENGIGLFSALERYFPLDPKREKSILEFVQLLFKFREVFRSRPLHEAIRGLIDDLQFNQFIDQSYESTHQQARRKKDVQHFIESAERFTRHYKGSNPLKGFLEKILLQDLQEHEGIEERMAGERNEITLLTLHSSKGLEYDIVFLIGLEEETLPHKKSLVDGQINEERRLCYVGLTRARKKLIMTFCKERMLYGKKIPRHRSRFILPYPSLYEEQDRTTFNHLSKEEVHQYQTNFFGQLLAGLDIPNKAT